MPDRYIISGLIHQGTTAGTVTEATLSSLVKYNKVGTWRQQDPQRFAEGLFEFG